MTKHERQEDQINFLEFMEEDLLIKNNPNLIIQNGYFNQLPKNLSSDQIQRQYRQQQQSPPSILPNGQQPRREEKKNNGGNPNQNINSNNQGGHPKKK